jgi:hypothetical protein
MRCAHSARLNKLIESYPKILYSIRAFTHALAYFNSCLNPYLYALLNRNYCINLVDIIPSWCPCCKHTQTLENGHSYSHSKLSRKILSPNQILLSKKYLNDDDDDDDDDDHHQQPTNDLSCQVELLGSNCQDISSLDHSSKLTRID